MLTALVTLLATPALSPAVAQDALPRPAPVEGISFRVFDSEGSPRSIADVLAAMDRAEVVLVGEAHGDTVGHALEAELLRGAFERFGNSAGEGPVGRTVVLSLEMFERDAQYVLDEYLADLITEDQFTRSARPWDRYATDYRPMVEYARERGLPVVAANAPRRYVNRVTRLGSASLADLPESAKQFLPPLPYSGPSDSYRQKWNAMMAELEEATPSSGGTPEHTGENALSAQALWDSAMGEAVVGALTAHPGSLVLHYVGAFHVTRGTGIPERVAEYRPGTRILTVVLSPRADVNAWSPEENSGLGDFVVLTKREER